MPVFAIRKVWLALGLGLRLGLGLVLQLGLWSGLGFGLGLGLWLGLWLELGLGLTASPSLPSLTSRLSARSTESAARETSGAFARGMDPFGAYSHVEVVWWQYHASVARGSSTWQYHVEWREWQLSKLGVHAFERRRPPSPTTTFSKFQIM